MRVARFDACTVYYCEDLLLLQVIDKLVQSPLTDRCFLTMTQALEGRLGGSPFGPAGTGKTESVKALGYQLGRFVLVFNCDEHFDVHVSRNSYSNNSELLCIKDVTTANKICQLLLCVRVC